MELQRKIESAIGTCNIELCEQILINDSHATKNSAIYLESFIPNISSHFPKDDNYLEYIKLFHKYHINLNQNTCYGFILLKFIELRLYKCAKFIIRNQYTPISRPRGENAISIILSAEYNETDYIMQEEIIEMLFDLGANIHPFYILYHSLEDSRQLYNKYNVKYDMYKKKKLVSYVVMLNNGCARSKSNICNMFDLPCDIVLGILDNNL